MVSRSTDSGVCIGLCAQASQQHGHGLRLGGTDSHACWHCLVCVLSCCCRAPCLRLWPRHWQPRSAAHVIALEACPWRGGGLSCRRRDSCSPRRSRGRVVHARHVQFGSMCGWVQIGVPNSSTSWHFAFGWDCVGNQGPLPVACGAAFVSRGNCDSVSSAQCQG